MIFYSGINTERTVSEYRLPLRSKRHKQEKQAEKTNEQVILFICTCHLHLLQYTCILYDIVVTVKRRQTGTLVYSLAYWHSSAAMDLVLGNLLCMFSWHFFIKSMNNRQLISFMVRAHALESPESPETLFSLFFARFAAGNFIPCYHTLF